MNNHPKMLISSQGLSGSFTSFQGWWRAEPPALIELELCTRPLLCEVVALRGTGLSCPWSCETLTTYVDFLPWSSTHNASILSCICKLPELYSSKWSCGFFLGVFEEVTPQVFRKRTLGAGCMIMPLARSSLFGRKLLRSWMFTLATSVHLRAYPKRKVRFSFHMWPA